jgi:hypothetical protein
MMITPIGTHTNSIYQNESKDNIELDADVKKDLDHLFNKIKKNN